MNFQTDTDKLNIVVNRYRNSSYLKDEEVDLNLTEYQSLLAKRVYLFGYIDIIYKRCLVREDTSVHNSKHTPSRMDALFLMSIFRLYTGMKFSFEHNSVCKNLVLSACFCWDSRLSLRDMDQKFNLVEPLILGTRTWSFYFVWSSAGT